MSGRNNQTINIGAYRASVSHKKAPTVKSSILPIYDGIRLYPFRLGIYKKEYAMEDLVISKVEQEGGNHTLKQIDSLDDFGLLGGHQATTYYPMIGKEYTYFPMPLRDGWVYVVSNYSKGVYEYRHINYTYKLEKFYEKGKTKDFPTNTLHQFFINLPAVDVVSIFYSHVRLEECLLRARFFPDGELFSGTKSFSVKKWVDENDTSYKSDIESRRLDTLELKIAYHKLGVDQDNVAQSDHHPFKRVVEEAIRNNPLSEKQRDIFFMIDDHLAIGEQIAENARASILGYDAFMRSLRTGKSIEEILRRLTAKSTNAIIKDEELFPEDKTVEQAQLMHSMALMVKRFFYDTELTGDLKDYQSKGAKDLKKEQLDAILATKLRKEIKDEIDKDRLALNYFINSRFLRSYVRFFLDRTEYATDKETDLLFALDVVEYDFLKEGAAYNRMLDDVKSAIIQFYQALKISPTVYDGYIDNRKEDIQNIKKTFDDFVDPDKLDELHVFLLDKEVVPQCFFDKPDKKGQEPLQLSFDSPDFFMENAFFAGACISTFLEYIFEPRKRDFIFRLLQSHGIVADFRNTFAHIPIEDIVAVVSQKQFIYTGSGISPSFIARAAGQPQATRIDISQHGLTINDETIRIKDMEVQYKSRWHGAKNTNIPKYAGIRTLELLKLINESPFFGPFVAAGALARILSVLENEEQSATHKANSVANALACAVYMSEGIIYKVFATTETKALKLPRINIRMGVTGVNLPATITLKTLFRSATIVANLTEMVDSFFKWQDQRAKGDTFSIVAYGTLSFLFAVAHSFLYFGPKGWIAYLIVTLALVITKVIVDLVVPSDLQLLINYTVFGGKCKYKMQYSKGNLTYQSINIHKDIYTLCTEVNKQIKHPKDKMFMKDFRFQLDEFMYVYTFTPSFHQCSLSFNNSFITKKYPDGVENLLPASPVYKAYYIDTKCPWQAAISITGNFVYFADVLENIELNMYMDSRGYCFNMNALADTGIVANGTVSANVSELSENEMLLGKNHKITYRDGVLQYYQEVRETRTTSDIGYYTNMKTYPLFYGDEYYIYLYVRFKTKGDINWAPHVRSDKTQYIIYRYKAEKTKKHDNFSFKLSFDKISIGEKLHK